MAKQTINIGTTANDGTGDAIRAAFGKVNDNFTEIYTANTGTNTGDQNLSAYATTAAVAAGYQPLDSDLTAISALTTTAYGRALLSTADAATLRSAIGVGTTDAPTFLAQTLTGQSLTGTQATSLVDMAATWNTTGTPSALKLNVTDTASNAASKLLDLQVSGVSKASISKSGVVTTWGGTYNTPSFMLGALGGVATNGSNIYLFNTATSYAIGLSSAGALMFGVDADTLLFRDGAAGILAQRNGVNAQAFRVANQVGASPLVDYDRGVFDFKTTTNTLRIGTENGGTYTTARPIDFVTGGVVRMSIGDTGITTFNGTVSCSSLLQLTSAGGIRLPSTGYGIYWNTSTTFKNVANGVLTISNFAENDFNRLQLGGTTSAFPAIKRNGPGIDIRLADDSGYANLTAGVINSSGVSAIQAGGNLILGTGGSGRALIFGGGTKSVIGGDTDGVLIMTNNAGTSFTRLELGTANLGISRGTGSPEGVVTALVGSLYIRTDGGASTTLYVKESSPTPSTGWVAK